MARSDLRCLAVVVAMECLAVVQAGNVTRLDLVFATPPEMY